MIAGSLEIQMLANMAELKKQMDQGVGMVKGATDQMIKAADMAGKALGAIGVALSVTAFTGFIKKAIDTADAFDEMSGRVGVSAKELSQLRLAYAQAGLGNDAMASSLAKLSKEMSDGNVGLRALGINAKNTDGSLRSTTSVLFEIADKFKGLEDGASKTTLAMEIFGKSGAEMVPLLSGGSEGIKELTELSEKLGIVIENETAAKAGQFNDTLELLQLGIEGVGARASAKLLPTLNSLTGSFLESMTAGDRLSSIANVLATALKGLYSVGWGVAEVFNTVGKTVGAAAAAVMAVVRGDLQGARNIMSDFKADVSAGWAASGAAIARAWDDEGNAAVEAAAQVVKSNRDVLGEQKAREASAKSAADAGAKAAAAQAKLLAESLKLFDGLLAQDSGLDKDFHKKWDELSVAYKSGKKSLDELIQAQGVLLSQQPFMKKAIEEETAARKAWRDERSKAVEAAINAATSMEEGNKQLRDEIALIGKSKKEQETILRLRREQVIAMKEGELAALQAKNSFDVYDTMMIQALQGQIEQLKERNELLGLKDVTTDAAEANQRMAQQFTQTVQQVEDIFVSGFADMMNNGKSGWESFCKSLKTSFFTMVAKEIYAMFAKPIVVQLVGSFMGMTGGGSAASAGLNGAGNLLGGMGNASSMWKAISGGMNASASLGKSMLNAEWFKNLGNEALQEMLGQFGAGMMNTASWSAASQAWSAGGAQMAGLVAGSLLNGFTGYGISRMLSGGYSAGGWVNTAAGIASMIPGIGPIAGVVGGIINRAFGRKLKDSGIEGDFGGETGFEGRQYEFYKGGWFRSNKTKYKDLDESTRVGFADQFTVLRESVESMGESLGLGSDLLTDFTYKMKLSLKGLSEEEAAKKIQEEFDKIADLMGGQVLTTDEYTRSGETQLEALTRLSTSLAAVNAVFDALGATLLEASLASADWASELIDLMGGMDNFNAAARTYYDLYYSDEEKRTRAAQQADKGMKDMGLDLRTGDVDAKAKYRALVDKAIAEKDEVMLAKLLQFAGDFAAGVEAVTASVQDATNEMAEAMQKQIEEANRIREETLSTLGLSLDGLVDGFINEINEGRGAQAGEWLANSIAAGFEQAIYRQAVNTILKSIIDGVITPVVTAAMAGSSVSGVVSGAAIETMVANAKAAAVALKTLLNDPAFKAMLDETIDFVRDLGNDIGSVIPPMSTYSPAIKEVAKGYDSATKAAEDAAAAAKKLADQWRKTTDSMLKEMNRLRGELLGVTDDHGAAYYEALFAIKTAQARAGDQDAADELPEIIRNLENIAKANASSQADVLLKQAEWLASLTDTRSYLAGKYGVDIGNQQVAEAAAAAAGRVIQTTGSAAFSGALHSSSDNPVLVSEVRALRVALENHDNNRKSEAAASVPAVQRMNKVLTRWDAEGMPQPREEEESA